MSRATALLASLSLLFAAGAQAKPHTIIRYHRSGGFAGVDQRLVIRSDNVALAYGRGSSRPLPAQLGAQQVRRLRQALDAAHLDTLHRHYPAPGAADTFQYSVTYKGHTVDADETKVPHRLSRALQLLQKTYDDILASSERYADPDHAALAAARAKWRKHGLRSYRFRLRVVCFCPGRGEAHTIRVRNGRPEGAAGAEKLVDTVPEMFHQIARALGDPKAGDVTARYDPVLGYPREASIDSIKNAVDDEISWSANRLKPL
jgi:hypothetical protein